MKHTVVLTFWRVTVFIWSPILARLMSANLKSAYAQDLAQVKSNLHPLDIRNALSLVLTKVVIGRGIGNG